MTKELKEMDPNTQEVFQMTYEAATSCRAIIEQATGKQIPKNIGEFNKFKDTIPFEGLTPDQGEERLTQLCIIGIYLRSVKVYLGKVQIPSKLLW